MELAMTGTMKWLLRLEALVVLVVAVAAYARGEYGWTRFAVLLLVPDVSLLAYLGGASVGACGYNLAHSYIGPLALLGVSVVAMPSAMPFGLIWLAHCGMDRALGYGLKYTTGFRDTHLGRIGRDKRRAFAAAA
jgi:hypothetical protein